MDTDERFKHLASDPRFKQLRKKQRKVQIDERFQSMFTDEKFTLKYSRDKRGHKSNKTSSDDLRRFYSLDKHGSSAAGGHKNQEDKHKEEDDEEDRDDNSISALNDSDDDEGEKPIEEKQDSTEDEDNEQSVDDEETELDNSGTDETDASELSSSSDESESEVEAESDGDEMAIDRIQYNWAPLDADADMADSTTKRLALQNLDWDRLDVKDLYTLVNSVRPPLSIKIYVSEFGKERLLKEEREGPKEIIEMPHEDEEEEEYRRLRDKMIALKDGYKGRKINEYEDADDEFDPKNEELRERIRRYQLSRMKYYYAVAEFDSVESAEAVYKELDGMEYEGSSLELDLRFVPDYVEFDEADLRAECSKLPDLTAYEAPQFINSALQQTKVRFSWDETDIKRQDKLRRILTKEELEKDDLEAYLGSGSESSEEDEEENEDEFKDALDHVETVSMVSATSRVRAEKYRRLLEELEEEKEKKKKVDVDVEWGDYSDDEARVLGGEDDRGSVSPSGSSSGDLVSDSDASKPEDGVEEGDEDDEIDDNSDLLVRKKDSKNSKERKTKKKKGKRGKKSLKNRTKDESDEETGELDLLVMDSNGDKNRSKEDFRFDPEDARFKAVYESGLYNIDPSHPSFKRTEAFDQIAERKRAKRLKLTASARDKK